MVMSFKWTAGYRQGSLAKAQDVGEELEALIEQKDGVLMADDVVQASASPESSMHPIIYRYSDEDAAYRYRLDEARKMLHSVRVVTEDNSEPQRVYVHVVTEDVQGYVTTARVQTEAELYARLLEIALKELDSFQKRYQQISELQPVLESIEVIRNGEPQLQE